MRPLQRSACGMMRSTHPPRAARRPLPHAHLCAPGWPLQSLPGGALGPQRCCVLPVAAHVKVPAFVGEAIVLVLLLLLLKLPPEGRRLHVACLQRRQVFFSLLLLVLRVSRPPSPLLALLLLVVAVDQALRHDLGRLLVLLLVRVRLGDVAPRLERRGARAQRPVLGRASAQGAEHVRHARRKVLLNALLSFHR